MSDQEQNGANVYLVTGSDEAGIQRSAEKLVQQMAGTEPDPFRFEWIREEEGKDPEETLCQVISAILSPGFTGGKTVYLENFSSFPQSGGSLKQGVKDAVERLAGCISEGLPEDVCLIMSAPGVDQRSKLAKACKSSGKIIVCDKPDLRKPRDWQPRMIEIIRDVAREKNVELPAKVAEYLTGVIGTDTARVEPELEKLICYCGGEGETITVEAAQQICQGQGEAISWSFLDAVGERRLDSALHYLDVLLGQSRSDSAGSTRGLIRQLARRWRELLQIRIYMKRKNIKHPNALKQHVEKQSNEDDEKADWVARGFSFLNYHPYRVLMLAGQALQYEGKELVQGMIALRDTDAKCVSTNLPPRLVLEQLVINLAGKEGAQTQRAAGRG